MPILVIADIFGIAGRRQQLIAALASAAREANAQDGCLRYSVAAAVEDHDHFIVVSHWRDEATIDAHYSAPAFTTFQQSLDGLLARPSEMTMYDVAGERRPLPSGPMDPRDAD